jgi:hypothetical protein
MVLIPFSQSIHTPFVSFKPSLGFPKNAEPKAPLLGQNALNLDNTKMWQEQHRGARYDLTSGADDCLTYIAYDEWYSALKETCADFEKKINKALYVIIIKDSDGEKSNPWVVQHALKFLSHQPTYIILSSQLKKLRNIDNLLIFDDASYSGSQFQKRVKSCEPNINNIYAATPFATSYARDKVEKLNLTLLCHKLIDDLNVFLKKPKVSKIISGISIGTSVAVFQHKLADQWSIITSTLLGHALLIKRYLAAWTLPLILFSLVPKPYKSRGYDALRYRLAVIPYTKIGLK